MIAIERRRGRIWEDLPGTPWRWLGAWAWPGYAAITTLRNGAYDRRWLPVHRLDVPVISVGNLTAGGTGKTPVARQIASLAAARGCRPQVLMRGYRGVDGANDEAQMLGEVPVVCDPDRVAGGRRAIAAGAGCLILDDGFQHRRLHRDLDIVVIDATRPWGGGLLPLGYRREGLGGLRRAHLAWVTRAHLADTRALCAGLDLPVVVEDLPVQRLCPLRGGADADAGNLAGRPVVLASGIGNPQGFEGDALHLGWLVQRSIRFPDHHHYDAADTADLAAIARSTTLVITAKDAVKLAPLWPADAPLPLVLTATSRLRPTDAPVLAQLLDRVLGCAGAGAAGGAG